MRESVVLSFSHPHILVESSCSSSSTSLMAIHDSWYVWRVLVAKSPDRLHKHFCLHIIGGEFISFVDVLRGLSHSVLESLFFEEASCTSLPSGNLPPYWAFKTREYICRLWGLFQSILSLPDNASFPASLSYTDERERGKLQRKSLAIIWHV